MYIVQSVKQSDMQQRPHGSGVKGETDSMILSKQHKRLLEDRSMTPHMPIAILQTLMTLIRAWRGWIQRSMIPHCPSLRSLSTVTAISFRTHNRSYLTLEHCSKGKSSSSCRAESRSILINRQVLSTISLEHRSK